MHRLSAGKAATSLLAKCLLATKTHRCRGARHPPSPGGSSHGGRRHSGEALQRRQTGREQLEAGCPEAGWLATQVTHGGKAAPPLQGEAESSPGCQGPTFPLPGRSCPQRRRSFAPQEAAAPALSSRPWQPRNPAAALPPTAPSAPATGQRAPTAAALPSQRPCKGPSSLRRGHALFPASHHGIATR